MTFLLCLSSLVFWCGASDIFNLPKLWWAAGVVMVMLWRSM